MLFGLFYIQLEYAVIMLINHSLQIKSSEFSLNPTSLRRHADAAYDQLKIGVHKSLSSGILHSAVEVYKQSPFLVAAVGGFSIASLIFVIIIFAVAGGNNNASIDGISDVDESLFGHQYMQARIKYDLNRIALSIIEGEDWDKKNIDQFATGWKALDVLEKAEVKQTIWFQSLENALHNNSHSDASGKQKKLLAGLADQLGVHLNVVAKREDPAKRPPRAVKVEAPKTNSDEPAPMQTAKPELAVPSDSQRAESVLASNNSQLQDQLAANTDQPVVSPQPVVSTPAPVSTVSQLTTPDSTKIQANQPSFSEISAKTVQRNRVNRVIRTPQPADTLPVVAAATAKQTATPSANEKAATPVPDQTASTSNIINETELQKITSEFVTSYETGNITTFTSLFAEKAISNDDADLNTIKEEYASLFAATSDRRMIIGDLKWDLSKGTATGEGSLEVAVKPAGADKAQTYSGTIQIVVEKQDDGVQITKLLHALQ